MKTLPFALCAVLLSSTALADHWQEEPEHRGSQITVAVNGLNCATNAGASEFDAHSWSWSASNSGSTGSGAGSGAGKASLGTLMIKKAFDACSPQLLAAVTSGKHFSSLVLTQEDYNGNTVATVKLTEVLVSSWSVGGNTRDNDPEESVAFTFGKVCLSAGSSMACYDVTLGRTT